MGETSSLLHEVREARQSLQRRLAGVSEEEMELPSEWHDRQVTVRFMFYRLLAHEMDHTVHLVKTLRGLGHIQTEAQLILQKLAITRGELEGLLVGLPESELDRLPGEGQWSVRQVVGHVTDVEETYLQVIEDALKK